MSINKKLQVSQRIRKLFRDKVNVDITYYVHPIMGFDVIGFDEWLIAKYGNYMDGKTSMGDFLEKKFGKEVRNLTEGLIKL